jgi:predicted transcriptional regulator
VLTLTNMAADYATMDAVAKMRNLQELTINLIEKFTKLRQLKVHMNLNFLTNTKLNAFLSEIIFR